MSLKRITMNTSTNNSYEKEPKHSYNSFFHSFYNSGSFMTLQTWFVFGRNSPLFTASFMILYHPQGNILSTKFEQSFLLIHTPALWLISGERASPCCGIFPPTVTTKSISVYPHFPTKCSLLGFTFHFHSIIAL